MLWVWAWAGTRTPIRSSSPPTAVPPLLLRPPTPAPTPTPAPSVRFYPNSVVPMLENVTGVAYNDSYSKDGVSVMYIYPLTSLPSDSGFFDTYDDLLTQHGFVMIGDSSSDDLIYRNASQKSRVWSSRSRRKPGRRPPWWSLLRTMPDRRSCKFQIICREPQADVLLYICRGLVFLYSPAAAGACSPSPVCGTGR